MVYVKDVEYFTEESGESESDRRTIVVHDNSGAGSVSKRGRTKSGNGDIHQDEGMEDAAKMEAISQGAADKLTGTHGAARQEQ